jgi:hypothetical protein
MPWTAEWGVSPEAGISLSIQSERFKIHCFTIDEFLLSTVCQTSPRWDARAVTRAPLPEFGTSLNCLFEPRTIKASPLKVSPQAHASPLELRTSERLGAELGSRYDKSDHP